jgi:hypothetical protein
MKRKKEAGSGTDMLSQALLVSTPNHITLSDWSGNLIYPIALASLVKLRLDLSECEENQTREEDKENLENSQYQNLPQIEKLEDIYKSLNRTTFKIPKLLDEKSLTQQQELAEHTMRELKQLEGMSDSQIEGIDSIKQKEIEIMDKGGMRYRKIDVLQDGQLKHGMKVQVGICDPNNSAVFAPLDKVLIYNMKGKYYTTGSF